jgi:hypothetical protein
VLSVHEGDDEADALQEGSKHFATQAPAVNLAGMRQGVGAGGVQNEWSTEE